MSTYQVDAFAPVGTDHWDWQQIEAAQCTVDARTMQDLISWLSARERDIADGYEDFFLLRGVFFSLFGRKASSV